MAMEAVRIAVEHMTPVMLLTDGYLVNGAEPWRLPDVETFPRIRVNRNVDSGSFQPYARNPETLVRPWVVPGAAGLEHRIGGLEKQDITGNVSYDPENHQHMIEVRAKKVANAAEIIPPVEVQGPQQGDLLVLSWGGTYGACTTAVQRAQAHDRSVAHAHLRWLNPFPANLGDILGAYERVLIPELNMGQLSLLIRNRYLIDTIGLNKVMGKPFAVHEVLSKILELTADNR